MADYIEILDLDIAVGSPFSAGLAARLRDNAEFIYTGGSGAPRIQTTAFDSLVVTADKLASSSIEASAIVTAAATATKIGSNAADTAAMKTSEVDSGGAYAGLVSWAVGRHAFWPIVYASGAYNADFAHEATNSSPEIRLMSDSFLHSNLVKVSAWRYVTASPPYDLGDGEIEVFAFCLVRDGEILAAATGDDPPWAFAGPTNTIPNLEHDGKKYVVERAKPCCLSEALSDPAKMEAYRQALTEGEWTAHEVDQKRKNRDMTLIPHPFREIPEGAQVVLIDPVSDLAADLKALRDAGENAAALIADGLVELLEPVDRHGPPGVTVRGARWRE